MARNILLDTVIHHSILPANARARSAGVIAFVFPISRRSLGLWYTLWIYLHQRAYHTDMAMGSDLYCHRHPVELDI